eukprot:TRINITY_DN2667_c0_g1_i1.p1 TRINITY_DN2667_c0_g1~~TRINITY_DN2667_c0_g1_i1.p1  ORF type:complete len:642 (-),score=141.05 TRINITY_DN2667_c0_g1_i1:55-1938(-)
MLDKATVFTKGGIVLWSSTFAAIHAATDPVDDFVRTVLLEERVGSEKKNFISGDYSVTWTLHNDLELIFVVVCQKILQLLYIDELLSAMKDKFCALFADTLRATKTPLLSFTSAQTHPFTRQFNKIQAECEAQMIEQRARKSVQRTFDKTEKGKRVVSDKKKTDKKKPGKNPQEPEEEPAPVVDETPAQPEPEPEAPVEVDQDAIIQMNRQRLMSTGQRRGPKRPTTPKAKPAAAPGGKKPRNRLNQEDEEFRKFMEAEKKRSNAPAGSADGPTYLREGEKMNLEDWDEVFKERDTGDDSSEESDDDAAKPAAAGGWRSITSIFSGLTNRVLTRNELTPVLAKLREGLIEKNVAAAIADELCESVCVSLEGKTLSSFKRIRTEVRNTMEEALTRILTPKRNIQLLREIGRVKQQEKRPFSIVMIGVNGVGKSTNLAKVCCYLMQQNLKVQIIACDTFRSGAVEQLKVHARNLQVPLFERGYEKDPAMVAANGIMDAAAKGIDVVLIDTAGRMQDNKPLMTALAKLIYVNNPDLILFVGEALVGNEAVDQLKKFNQELEEHAPPSKRDAPRLIDGIILTKFDTIDTKVGAAISMVYTTGQPIVFVGTGQNYTDLKTMNVPTVVQALLG